MQVADGMSVQDHVCFVWDQITLQGTARPGVAPGTGWEVEGNGVK